MTRSQSFGVLAGLALAGVAIALLGACGGETSESATGNSPITAEDVQARFDAEGIKLSSDELRFGDPRVDGTVLRPTEDDAVHELGDFSISVLASSRAADANIHGNPIWKRDGRIYWYRVTLEQPKFAVAWSAATRYDNVILHWYPNRRAVDGSWRRLDQILREVHTGRG